MIDQLFSPDLIQALGWTLVHTLWQGALFALLLGVLLVLLRTYSAQARYLTATGLLAGFLLTVVFTFTRTYTAAKGDSVRTLELSLTTNTTKIATVDSPTNVSPLLTEAPAERTIRLSFRQRMVDYYDAHLPLIVSLWLMGILFLQLRFLGQLAFVQRLKSYGTERLPSTWAGQIQELEERLGIRRSVRYLTSYRIDSPQTIGWLRPVVLFPEMLLAELKDSQIVSILAHELAHIKRNDFLVNVLQTFLCTLFFYHPGLWWMSARIRDEREHCCDDLAIQVTGQPVGYAKTLIQLKEKEMSYQQPALAYQGNAQTGFKRRITRLLSGYIDRATYSEGIVTALILVLALGTAVYAANYQLPPLVTSTAEISSGELSAAESVAVPAIEVDDMAPLPPTSTTGVLIADQQDRENENRHFDLFDEVGNFELLMEAIYDGNFPLVEHFLEGNLDLNRTDRRKFTPLMAAANEDHPEIARLLINKGAEVNFVNSEGWTALIEAADEGAYATTIVLLEAGAKVNLTGPNSQRTALSMAASEGHPELMRLLIKAGANLGRDGKGSSLLHIAAEEGQPEVIALLLSLGADVNLPDAQGRTPLSHAAEEDQNAVVRQLLDAGADPNILDEEGRSALQHAAGEGAESTVTLLLNNVRTDRRQVLNPSVLIDAADEGALTVVKQLVRDGADVNATDRYGNTPLMAAAREAEHAVARYLLEQGADVRAGKHHTPLSLAARESDPEMVRLLMDQGAEIETYHDFESISMNKWKNQNHLLSIYKQATPLIIAIEENDIATVKALLAYRPDVNRTIRKLSFKVPATINWNEFSDQSEAMLIENYDLRYNTTGWTVLMEAVETGNPAMVELLLDAGAKAKAVTSDGMTARDLAQSLNFGAIVKLLAR